MATLAQLDRPQDAAAQLQAAFEFDVLEGLAQERKAVPARWFYDHRGSELFEEITRRPEYYPTRSEVEILTRFGGEIGEGVGPGRAVVEFGAGSATKTPLLLDRIAPAAYVPIDISGDFLRESCAVLARRYPGLRIDPVEADFTCPVTLPLAARGERTLGFFPGSTIGNLGPDAAVDLLRAMRATLGQDGMLLIGMDRIKDLDVLARAYDDAAGVTADFNRNLATRINRELDGTIPLDRLQHRAIWNPVHSRVEMHLEAATEFDFEVRGRRFAMRAGETIHTENSHKYDLRSATTLLLAGGWEPIADYSDAGDCFMVILARASAEGVSA